ncbi:MAG TPA: outer membrane beta-barrel protein [Bacteroidia bacterium]|jgi:hypothetical protein|nr:outer membrane beta-barrel protein [Bacteroidia bacterium]
MKHLLTLTASLLITFSALRAQSFQKGQVDLNLGIGLGNTIIGPGNSSTTPPLSLSLGFGITRDISIGGYLGYTSTSYLYPGWEDCGNGQGNGQYFVDTYKWSYLIIGLQADFHFGRFIPNEKVDLYAGLLLGNDFATSRYSTTSYCPDHIGYAEQTYGGVLLSVHAGVRYHFTPRFGLFAELGYGISYLNMGVTFKF